MAGTRYEQERGYWRRSRRERAIVNVNNSLTIVGWLLTFEFIRWPGRKKLQSPIKFMTEAVIISD